MRGSLREVFSESLGFADSVLIPGIVEKVMTVKGTHNIGVRYEEQIDISNVSVEMSFEDRISITVE